MNHPVQSRFLDLGGPLHVTDYGGEPGARTVLCIHGLGSSAVSWTGLARALAPDHRVLALDLPGHGRSPLAGRPAGVHANSGVLARLMDRVGPAVLIGHSMGAALALLHAGTRPADVSGLVLLAPPMPRMPWEPMTPELVARVALCAWPWLGRAALSARSRRLGPDEVVRRGLALTCASPDVVDEETRQMLVQRAEAGCVEDHATFVEAARSVGLLVARAAAYRHAIATVVAPGLVVQGVADRLVDPAGLNQLAGLQRAWGTVALPAVGHSPHLEAPREVAAHVRAFTRGLTPTSTAAVPAAHDAPANGQQLALR